MNHEGHFFGYRWGWREGRTLKQLQSIFEINGVRHVVGMTPVIEGVIRGQEIQSYREQVRGTELEVTKFVILDDEEEMGDLQPYLLETEFQTGITTLIRDEAIKKLI